MIRIPAFHLKHFPGKEGNVEILLDLKCTSERVEDDLVQDGLFARALAGALCQCERIGAYTIAAETTDEKAMVAALGAVRGQAGGATETDDGNPRRQPTGVFVSTSGHVAAGFGRTEL